MQPPPSLGRADNGSGASSVSPRKRDKILSERQSRGRAVASEKLWWAGRLLVFVSFAVTVTMTVLVHRGWGSGRGLRGRAAATVTASAAVAGDVLLDVSSFSCKAASVAGHTVSCCANAPSDAVRLSATRDAADGDGGDDIASVAQGVASTSGVASGAGAAAAARRGDGLSAFTTQASAVPRPVAANGLHVLVTGGAGYIGSHATLRLLEDGHAVTIVDNLSRGNGGAVRALQRVAARGQLRFVLLDLGDADRLTRLFRQSLFDVVVHFAAVAYVAESYRDPLLYYRNVTANTMHVLEAMRASNVTRIVYSSTCATYGNPETMPITEATPQSPVSPYGSSKLVAEQMLMETTASTKGFAAIILRYFNVIGSDPQGRVGEHPTAEIAAKHGRISGACFNAALGRLDSLSITGTDFKTPDGTCVRDYIHVVDLVDAHVRALGALKAGVVRVYNVGVGKGYSVREFVDACVAVTGVNITVVERERRPGDAAAVYSDPKKIKRELGWAPRFTSLNDSLATSWNWTLTHPEGYDGGKPERDWLDRQWRGPEPGASLAETGAPGRTNRLPPVQT